MRTLWLVLPLSAAAPAAPVALGSTDAPDTPLEKPVLPPPASGTTPVPLHLGPARLTTQDAPECFTCFDADEVFRSRHYLVLDQRGADAARDTALFLERAFDAFERILRAAPRVEDEHPLTVEVFVDRAQWRERLSSLALPLGRVEDPSRYDARSRRVLILAGDTGYETRARLLGATMRQFHHRAKRKHAALVDDWFVIGLSEMAAMHRWDGEELEIGARLLLSKVDTPALALVAMQRRPANLSQFTPEVLENPPMAWTLTGFLLEGEDSKHRKRFQKLALGHRGSMLDGAGLAQSLGPADEILPAIERWLHSRQQPFEILAGEFEDLGEGRIVGIAAKDGSIAAPRAPVTRLSCVLDLEPDQAAGLLVGERSADSRTYLLFQDHALYLGHLRRNSHELEPFRFQPRAAVGRLEVELSGTDGLILLRVQGEDVGHVVVPRQRLGLVAMRGSTTFSEIDWE